MRKRWLLKLLMAGLLGGQVLTSMGCSDLVRQSVRDGTFRWVAGSVTGTLGTAQFAAFLTNVLTGGLTGLLPSTST